MTDFGPVVVASELEAWLADPDLKIIDCRFDLLDPAAGESAWRESHLPGAVYLDLERDLSGPVSGSTGRHPLPDPARLAERFGAAGISRNTRVVVYDSGNGAFAARAWWLLRWLGHGAVALLEQGYAGWQAAGRPLDANTPPFEARDFVAQPRPGLVASTDEIVAAAAAADGLRLVDARDRARFRGEAEPIDAVAGHIPGAANLPFTECLDEAGRFHPVTELRALYAGLLGERHAEPWTVMCGSGVTACHLAISALLAGYAEPRLYAGSWSEWIRDPARGIARGD